MSISTATPSPSANNTVHAHTHHTPHTPHTPGEVEGLSASRISDIVTASSLTDEEIQNLIDKLLEMMEANAEWKGVSKYILPLT